MANRWTEKQFKAIRTNGCNILVAAAAGSGKTAVLVERIIRKITAEDGTDVDRMVVVTFTKAAAAEMKQRIREALDAMLQENPGNERLIRQMTLIHNAPITTIDSFCLNIVRNYFTDIELDPGFRIADEGEMKLLENDVMEEMLEEYYASENQVFFDFVDAYGTGRDDTKIVDIILKLYRFARSYPWPEEWFKDCLCIYRQADIDTAEQNAAISYLFDTVRRRFKDYDRQYEKLENICNEPDGPLMYAAAVQSDHAGIRQILDTQSYEELVRKVRLLSFETLGRSRSKDISEVKKAAVKQIRDEYKAYVTKTLQAKLFTKEFANLLEDIRENKPAVEMMMTLAQDFYRRMDTEKRERNVIDFNDMEHMALNILVKKTENGMEYTKAADDLSAYYEEILIDEYQDSNMLQEVILTAVSKGKYNEADNNIYMVGDVKQSIYKFRLACPKLFMDKYSTYTDTDSPNVRIELQTNFRSRENVLECTNDVFYRAMNPYFAEIEYDDRARLNAGFEYPKYQAQNENAMTFADDPDTMIYMIDMNQEKLSPEDEDRSAREREGAAAAALIQRLTQPKEDGSFYMVYDKNAENGYRRIRYSDIVILTRTVSGWADTFVNVLMNEDIPAYCDASEGYFDVREVKLLLSYLAVIDNPLQDIPMAAVMLSFFGRFTTEELTQIRMKDTTKHLHDVMQESDDEKVVQFLKQLDSFREKAERYPVSDVLWELMYDTGYYHYAGTMPAGTQRQANLDMLYTKAAAFEKTSYSGLFQFLRYIERLKKYEVDFAEASVLGENENLVRVMSIHKSKGLEFPVVILAGMGKSINQMDSRGEVVLDTDFGVGTNVVHLDKRIKNPTLLKSAVSQKLIQETISEELRVLYVAMTRAREKLYMIGTVKDAQKAVEGWQAVSDELLAGGWYSYSYEAGLKNYFDMVMPAVLLPQNLRKGTFQIVEFKKEELQVSDDISMEVSQAETDISKEAGQAESDMRQAAEAGEVAKAEMNDAGNGTGQQNPAGQELEKLPDYPYADEPVMKPKVTVSELKKMQQDSDFAETAYMPESLKQAVDEQNEDELLPEFIAGRKKTLQGSRRGTAYHRVMECMDYDTKPENTAVKAFLKQLVEEEKLTKQQADSIRVSDIVAFMKNPLFERMKRAKQAGVFHTEQPFVFIDLSEQSDKSKQDDTNQPDKNNGGQLIQGVIDVYFEEDGSLILVDYKTDKVSKKGGEDELRRRYALQLEYYAKALSQLLQRPVKEKIIYSFSLGKDIELE